MLRLMLLRHAKSSWADAGMDDKDRPLSPRGLRSAPLIGSVMKKRSFLPDLVFCSPARRARDTWKLVAAELPASPKTLIEDGVYDFGNGGRLVQTLATKATEEKTVLFVGHNPSIERLAKRYIGRGDEKLRKRLESKFPTGALAVIDFGAKSWSELEDGSGKLEYFVRPRDLEADS